MPQIIYHHDEWEIDSILPTEHEFELVIGQPEPPQAPFHALSASYSWTPSTVRKGITVYALEVVGPDLDKVRIRCRVEGPGTLRLSAVCADEFGLIG